MDTVYYGSPGGMLFTLIGRRTATALLMAAVLRPSPTPAAELIFKDAGPEGFQYADSKLGSGGTLNHRTAAALRLTAHHAH